MQCLKIEDLRTTVMPPELPATTALGVWKRSTGFEISIPYHRRRAYWGMLIAGLVLLSAVVATAIAKLTVSDSSERAVLYLVSTAFVLAYVGFFLLKIYETRKSKINIVMTRLTLDLAYTFPFGRNTKIGTISLPQVDAVCIDEQKGVCFRGPMDAPPFGVWVGRGLNPSDLYYLALLVGQVAELPQTAEPEILSRL